MRHRGVSIRDVPLSERFFTSLAVLDMQESMLVLVPSPLVENQVHICFYIVFTE